MKQPSHPTEYVQFQIGAVKKDDYLISPIEWSDQYPIREWRNKQLKILRQQYSLSKDEQEIYFAQKVMPTFYLKKPEQLLFRIEKEGELIGYGGIVHLDWQNKNGEISFLVNPIIEEKSEEYSSSLQLFIEYMKTICENNLKLNRIFTITYSIRKYHQKALEKSGMKYEGTLKKSVVIDGKVEDSLIHAMVFKQ